MFESMFQMIAPHHCVNCNARGQIICEKCVQFEIKKTAETCYRCNKLSKNYRTCPGCRSSSSIYALFKISLYESPIKELVLETKFASAREGADALGVLIASRMPEYDFDIVTYIPTDTKRVRYRGFDHAYRMARALALYHQKPISGLLIRRTHTRQFGSTRYQRKQQMETAFVVSPKSALTNKKILLVDDVVSTAASIEAAAKTLKMAGARRVTAVVAAHNR